jgi:hypothetical protein
VLVAIDGKQVSDPQGVLNLVTGIAPGSAARMKMKRKGQDVELAVTIGRRPKQQPSSNEEAGGARLSYRCRTTRPACASLQCARCSTCFPASAKA